MNRLVPLPERSSETKTSTDRRSTAVQKELDELKHQLQELQDVQLESQKSQLIAAQERLKQRRKSELAKRMQETQRLQLLKEQRAELDDDRRTKVSGFKQRMIAAAERQLSRESNIYDALYENIGEALLEGEEDESTVYEEDHGAIEFHPRAITVEPLPPIIERPAYLDSIRVKSAFEEQLGATQAKFSSQRRALQSVHATYPAGTATPHRTSIVISSEALYRHEIAQERPTKNSLVADFLNSEVGMEALSRSAQQQKASNDNTNDYYGLGCARDEHRKLREELWRLLSQAGEDPALAMPPQQSHLEAPVLATDGPSEPMSVNIDAIAARASELDARDTMQAVHDGYVAASAVRFEDQLHRGVAIQNDAEENIRQQRMLVDRRHRPSQLAPIRSHSLVVVPEDSMHSIPSAKKKDRRVSMLVEGDSLLPQQESTPAEEPITVAVGRQRSRRDLPSVISEQQQRQDAEKLRIEQEQARYFAKRAQRSNELRALQQTLESLERTPPVVVAAAERPLVVRRKARPLSADPSPAEDTPTEEIEAAKNCEEPATNETVTNEEAATEIDPNTASLRIQCQYRKHLASKEVAHRRARYEEQLHEQVQLTLLSEKECLLALESERYFRWKLLLAEENEIRALERNEQFVSEASELQALHISEGHLTKSRVSRCQQDAAATRVQCAVRQWIARHNVTQRRQSHQPGKEDAARVLQKWWRSCRWKQNNKPHPRRGLMRRYGPYVDCGGFFDVAAVAIQCLMRRHFAKRMINRKRENRQAARQTENENNASALIQEAWRSHEVRQAPKRSFVLSLIDDSVHTAAVLRATSCDPQKVSASEAIEAATRISSTVRGMMVRRQLQQKWVSAYVDHVFSAVDEKDEL